MEEVKDKLTEQDVESNVPEKDTEENVEDYFNPFADVKEEVKEEVVEEVVEDEKKEEVKPPVVDRDNELKEVKATIEAQRTVGKFIKENPMYADFSEEIAEMTAKAIVRKVANPVEFAIRNIRSPQEWIEIGRKSGIEDAGTALRSRVGGSSFARGEETVKDFGAMNTNDFEAFVNSIKNQ